VYLRISANSGAPEERPYRGPVYLGIFAISGQVDGTGGSVIKLNLVSRVFFMCAILAEPAE
jgi:hypothetical protein